MALYTMPERKSKLELIANILAQGIGGYQQGKEQKEEKERQGRFDPLQEMLLKAKIGSEQRKGIPKAPLGGPLKPARDELKFWQGILANTYKKGIMGEMGEIMEGQEDTNKLAQKNIARLRKKMLGGLLSQPGMVAPQPKAISPKPKVVAPKKSIRKRLAEAFGLTATKPKTEARTEKDVNVIAPDGRRGSIPRSELKDALAQGYKLAR